MEGAHYESWEMLNPLNRSCVVEGFVNEPKLVETKRFIYRISKNLHSKEIMDWSHIFDREVFV